MKLLSFAAWAKRHEYKPFLSYAVLDTKTGDAHLGTNSLYHFTFKQGEFIHDGRFPKLSPIELHIQRFSPETVLCYVAGDARSYPGDDKSLVFLEVLRGGNGENLCGLPSGKRPLCLFLSEEHMQIAFGRIVEKDEFLAFSHHLDYENVYERFCFGVCMLWQSYCSAKDAQQAAEAEAREAAAEAEAREAAHVQKLKEQAAAKQREKTLKILSAIQGE